MNQTIKSKFTLQNLRRIMTSGLIVIIPFVFTAYILKLGWSLCDGWINHFGVHVPGAGIVALLCVIFAAGLFATQRLGQIVLDKINHVMERFPGVKWAYTTAKDVSETLLISDGNAFRQVVFVKNMNSGIGQIGFLTADAPEALGNAYVTVVVFQAFGLGAGLTLIVPRENVSRLNMTVEEAMKYTLTAGLVKEVAYAV